MVRILMTKITDAKTSMETDHVIDLKKTLIPIQDEVVRIRDGFDPIQPQGLDLLRQPVPAAEGFDAVASLRE